MLEHIRELGIGVRFGFGGGVGEVGTGQCSALVQFYKGNEVMEPVTEGSEIT